MVLQCIDTFGTFILKVWLKGFLVVLAASQCYML